MTNAQTSKKVKTPEELESLEMKKQGYPYCWLDVGKNTHCSACREHFRKAKKKRIYRK